MGILDHALTQIVFGGPTRTPNNSEGKLASQNAPGSPSHKKEASLLWGKLQLQVCCGASKENFLTVFHERPSMP